MTSDYSAGWMAPIGQASAQVPQSMQAFLLANSIVQDGHASLPLLADSKSSFFKAKAIKVGIVLIVFVVWGLIL